MYDVINQPLKQTAAKLPLSRNASTANVTEYTKKLTNFLVLA